MARLIESVTAPRECLRRLLVGLALLLTARGATCAPEPAADRDFFVIASVQLAVLHEVGHVVMTELEPPFLGQEEDVADQLATAALLLERKAGREPRAKETLIAAAQAWRIEWELQHAVGDDLDYWDSHPLDIQRYYNIVCLLYGSEPDPPQSLATELQLHRQRAWRCDEEYRRVLRGLRWIQDSSRSLRPARTRVGVIYEPPATPEREAMHDLIRRSGVLERTARIVETQFTLPRDINIVVANLCGATAYWRKDLQEIVVCYALVERFARMARFRSCLAPTPDWEFDRRHALAVRRCVSEYARQGGAP